MTPIRTILLLLLLVQAAAAQGFRAGAATSDISPTKFPTPVNGSMKGGFAQGITDPLLARSLALSDGKKELIFTVVDACMIPREICEEAKAIAAKKTGVPAAHMLISATHTHSAATLAAVFQSDPDPEHVATVAPRIAQAIVQAHANLELAEVAWGKGSDPTQVFNRRWLLMDQQPSTDPFGLKNEKARMNPGYQSPQVSSPVGPIDPDVFLLVARSTQDQRPIGLLANYSLHYVGGLPALSSDYFGAFAREMTTRLNAEDQRYSGKPPFVAFMSNGTSGDINNVNFSMPPPSKREPGQQIRKVAASVAEAAMQAYAKLTYKSDVTLDCAEEDLHLKVRKANADELAKARETLTTTPKDKDGQFGPREAIYAREAVLLDAFPDAVPVKVQVHRVGDLSIGAIPCEVFVEIGLELKARTPFIQHFTISLANGYNGYLPTPHHHMLGGYETWRARSSYLEVPASDRITERLLALMQTLKERK